MEKSFRDKLNDYDYNTKLDYPRPDKIITCPKCGSNVHVNKNFCGDCGSNVEDYRADRIKKYTKATQDYGADINRLEDEFKKDLYIEAGHDIIRHPKVETIYYKAYTDGHANGYHEIAEIFLDLVSFLDDLAFFNY